MDDKVKVLDSETKEVLERHPADAREMCKGQPDRFSYVDDDTARKLMDPDQNVKRVVEKMFGDLSGQLNEALERINALEMCLATANVKGLEFELTEPATEETAPPPEGGDDNKEPKGGK